ncbi:unnamed protein product, partial [Iphiclides podalirius]
MVHVSHGERNNWNPVDFLTPETYVLISNGITKLKGVLSFKFENNLFDMKKQIVNVKCRDTNANGLV